MSQSQAPDYQVRFIGALLAGFFMAAIGFWAMESGYRLPAIFALAVFALIWLYAVIAWVLWTQARYKSKGAVHDREA